MKNKIILLVSLIFASSLVNAFGASSPYFNNNPLILSPGESKDIEIYLQNMVGDKDITLQAEILLGKEIASFLDTSPNYLISFGKKDIKANLKITIPKEAKDGDKYTISINFKEKKSEKQELLQITGGVTTSFPIIIKELQKSPKETSTKTFFYLIISTLILSIIIVIVLLIKSVKSRKGI